MDQGVTSILLMTALLVIIYFIMIRPQRKKDKEDKEMRANLKVGDEIITIGGVIGRIERSTRKALLSQLLQERTRLSFLRLQLPAWAVTVQVSSLHPSPRRKKLMKPKKKKLQTEIRK